MDNGPDYQDSEVKYQHRRYVSCIPAYGRDYNSQDDVYEDWLAGKDFLTQDLRVHGYVNKDDKPPDVILNIRFNKLADICVIDTDGTLYTGEAPDKYLD